MPTQLVLQIAPGNAFSQSDFVLGVSEEFAADLTDVLLTGGISAEVPLSHGIDGRKTVDILVTVGAAFGGLDALATLLATYLDRHKDKKVVLPDGTSLTGYSATDAIRIGRALTKIHKSTEGATSDGE